MGDSRWSPQDWNQHSTATKTKSLKEIFTQDRIDPSLDPSKFEYRESCDSQSNPESTPIIIAADNTGSMGILAENIIKFGLGTIMGQIYDKKPVPDPHIMCVSIGDVNCDSAPVQATQFEADMKLVDQLKKMYIEGGGGGNGGESYPFVWALAHYKTKCDSILKNRRKGYIFTIGDECPHRMLEDKFLKQFLNISLESNIDSRVILYELKKNWHVFHLIVKPISGQPVIEKWKSLLQERAILVDNVETIAEGIVSTIQLVEGQNPNDVIGGWQGKTAISVTNIAKQLLLK